MAVIAIITLPLVALSINEANAEQQLVKEILITLVYDPFENAGLISYNVLFTEKITNYTRIRIPMLLNNASDILVLDEENRSVIFEVINGEIEVLVNNTGKITIVYSIENAAYELTLNAYILDMNLTMYANYNFNLHILLPNVFSVVAIPEADVVYENNLTIVILDKPEEYSIVLYKELGAATATAVTTPTRETTPVTPPTSETTSPPEAYPAREEERRGEGKRPVNFAVVAVAIVVLLLAITLVWFLTKKH